MNSWVLERMRITSSRVAAAWALVVAGLAAALYTQAGYYRNCLAGPYAVDEAALSAVADPATAANRYVVATGTKLVPTGLQEVTTTTTGGVETGSSPSAEFVALLVGKRFLVCRTAHASALIQRGELKAMTAELDGKLFGSPEMKAAKGRFYPFYLDDDDFRTAAYWHLAGALAVAALAYFFGVRAWRRSKDTSLHPVAKRLEAIGDAVGLSAHAEQEFKVPRFKAKPDWVVTENFLIASTFFYFDLQRTQDLQWAHKKVTQRRVYFIPIGKTYAAVLKFRDGEAELIGSESDVDRILRDFGERVPWAVFGFTKELETLWTLKRRPEFIAAVDERKKAAAAARRPA